MNELLAVSRGEYQPANWYYDEEGQFHASISVEVSVPRFERFMEIFTFIQQMQMDVKMRYIQIGCALLEIEREKLYQYVAPKNKGTGYSTFYGFCQEVFGFKKTTTANMVAVAREFCSIDGGVKIEYLNYSYSQLLELLGIDEKYRPRIPIGCSVRDIKRLKEYYKDNVPKAGGTVEDDLEAWNQICKAEKEKKNKKRNAITFIPAKKEEKENTSKKGEQKAQTPNADDFDGEDERDVVTPTEKKVSFDAVRNGLYRQLALLRKCFTESANGSEAVRLWDDFATHVETALRNRFPDYIVPYNSSLTLSNREPASGKLYLKNAKERKEWLENYQSWGVWLDVPEVSKKFYRYDFENGDSMIVEEYIAYWSYSSTDVSHVTPKYSVLDKKHHEYGDGVIGGVSGAVDWLTKHAKEI